MLTWLYVPGDRPDRFARAVDSGADTVIIDLEDAVHPDRKAYARAAVAEFCARPHPIPVQVRINPPGTPYAAADLAVLVADPAVAGREGGPDGLRVPKVSSPGDVTALARAAPGMPLHCLLESAVGVEFAYAIATAGPAVASIGLGEADLRSDLGVADESGLLYARARVVLAARAAGLPAPAMSVYPDVRDLAGLAESCRTGAALGFLGRAAIHPAQLPVIVDAFRPSADRVRRAEEVLAALGESGRAGSAVAVLPDGRFADPAMVRSAERTLALARRYPPS